jgi:DNA-binding transcriptional LysR family regulator
VTAERDFDRRFLCVLLRGIAVRHLAALVAVASESSSSAAARSIGCSESALSRHLSELEVAMGASLIVRARGDARLTEGGTRVLPHAEAVLSRVETARSELTANLDS